MSLILDALRKSEAERRRGQAPDLFASLPPPSAPGRGGLARYWPALVLGGLLLGAGFVFWHGRAAAPAADADAEVAEVAEAAPASAAQAPWPSPAPAPASPAGAPAITQTGPGAAPPPSAQQPQPPPPSPALPPAAAPGAAARSATIAAPTPLPAPPARPAATVVTQAAPAVTPPGPPAPAASSDTAIETDASDALPPIAILAASERAALPPLKLSMHVWNSEPGKRFAIIDGQRVTEGSSAGGSVIEEIRRDGVVLNVNGRRVLLPRP